MTAAASTSSGAVDWDQYNAKWEAFWTQNGGLKPGMVRVARRFNPFHTVRMCVYIEICTFWQRFSCMRALVLHAMDR